MRFIKLLFLAFAAVFAWYLWVDNTPTPPQMPKTPPSAEEIAANKRFTKVQQYGVALKKQLREPDSVEWLSIGANDDASVACFKYKARNGFGGMGAEYTVVVSGLAMTDSASWGKHCAGKSMNNMGYVADAIY